MNFRFVCPFRFRFLLQQFLLENIAVVDVDVVVERLQHVGDAALLSMV
jgi:hypothetical protein